MILQIQDSVIQIKAEDDPFTMVISPTMVDISYNMLLYNSWSLQIAATLPRGGHCRIRMPHEQVCVCFRCPMLPLRRCSCLTLHICDNGPLVKSRVFFVATIIVIMVVYAEKSQQLQTLNKSVSKNTHFGSEAAFTGPVSKVRRTGETALFLGKVDET